MLERANDPRTRIRPPTLTLPRKGGGDTKETRVVDMLVGDGKEAETVTE